MTTSDDLARAAEEVAFWERRCLYWRQRGQSEIARLAAVQLKEARTTLRLRTTDYALTLQAHPELEGHR
jgi:hypothetical protein